MTTVEQAEALQRVRDGLSISCETANLLMLWGYVRPYSQPSAGSDYVLTRDGNRFLNWWRS
jgi:hypothetical protein